MNPPILLSGSLSPAECARLKAEMDAGGTPAGPQGYDHSYRRVTDVTLGEWATSLVAGRVWDVAPQLMASYGPVTEMEPSTPRFLTYGPGDHIGIHTDSYGLPRTRISISLFIASATPGEDALRVYQGDPRTADGAAYWPIAFEPGMLVAFDSDAYHEVMPVSANRYTSVIWLLS